MNGTTTLVVNGTVLNLGMLAHALESDTNANILSAPNLMTLDNEEAKIVVGQNVPFITGQYAQTGSTTTASPFQTIERKDVGLTLKIKPQIMQGGTVKLQVYQEVSSVDASSITSVRRHHQQTLHRIQHPGGRKPDRGTRRPDPGFGHHVASKTPLLGDIPVLGKLFRYETREHTKTNLMVFIRPYIMYQSDGYQKVTREHYEQISKIREGARMPDHWILPNDDKNKALPPIQSEDKVPAVHAAAPSSSDSHNAAAAASAPAAATPAESVRHSRDPDRDQPPRRPPPALFFRQDAGSGADRLR